MAQPIPVLVVEDDELIRIDIVDFLGHEGFVDYEAAGADEDSASGTTSIGLNAVGRRCEDTDSGKFAHAHWCGVRPWGKYLLRLRHAWT
jgi:hypothetical protein